ncbi:MAG: FKBP-type peptidyl-prolyl cis-trans isomerase [Candidatus Paraprevotella stercoravium]|jgi:FKBP-type peptidyl-prolyl cis-trans isomerase FklB|uniref:Peptidyl-prolyl cis-trans isomerase n=2 Tax=Bacteroidales TaxID=171549 RepID=A0ABT7U3K4_9BACE|nr:FKBP-type peptidyl-prolyl cis-trans isomerase [Candidatus Paraprevotella stercoravium]MDM8145096.1 FKBP-type peptidyl-prolyl cis-trans isomerase [Bacteroides eggerthii]
MRKYVWYLCCLFLSVFAFVACDENEATFDKYESWQQRNKVYFEQVADTARRAIAAAKAEYGDQWEQYCDWRMYQAYTKPVTTKLTDSICVKVLETGTGKGCPLYTDTVRVHYRGTLMPTKDIINGKDTVVQDVFDYSFVPPLDLNLAFPKLFGVSGTIAGFGTALQYMHCGDRWMVYIPETLGYGSTAQNKIPAYSTIMFDVTLVDYFYPGEGIPDWH